MIKQLVMVSCLALATGAFAQSSATTSVNANSNSASVSGSSSTNNGNTQAIIFTGPEESTSNIKYSGDQKIRNVPSVSGPPLVSSNDTCMGSTSGSVNGPGFGVGLGTTWTDDNCVMLKNSRELWNMGMKAASMALMCTDIRTRRALEVTGFNCPNHLDGQPKVAATAKSAEVQEQYTDPIIRARLGLPPLAAAK
jgi:hypothetical protein